jgi:membrane-associated phospholipid phosphatase
MKGLDMGLDHNVVKTSGRTTLARWISRIVHPVVFPLITLGIVTYYADPQHSLVHSAQWVVLALLLTTVPISLLVLFQVLRGHWSDLDVSVRRQRYTLYPFGLACMVALGIAFVAFRAPAIAISATAAIVLANLVDGFINLVYKVSAHATAAAMCAAVLYVGAPLWTVPAALAAVLVGWSRVVLGRHTAGQVILGWLVGISCVAAVLVVPAHVQL